MDEVRKVGSVKFYSTEKGYGFIYCQDQPDTFFHVTEVDDPLPPPVGSIVSFSLVTDPRTLKLSAKHVRVENRVSADAKTDKQQNELDGFPCIRGSAMSGFVVEKNFGNIRSGSGWFRKYSTFDSANSAKDALIERAQSMGANAIINYVWHNDRTRTKGLFGDWIVINAFWAEGEAVLLVPK